MNVRTGKGICSKSKKVYIGDPREAFVTTLLGWGPVQMWVVRVLFQRYPAVDQNFHSLFAAVRNASQHFGRSSYHNIKKKVRRDLRHINYIHLTIHNLASQLLLFLLAFPNRHLFRPRRIRPAF